MTMYVVIYSDYDSNYIEGIFTDKDKAEKCKEYHLKLIENRGYNNGENIDLEEIETSDDIDYNSKILELEQQKIKKKKEQEELVKKNDLEEFNRIKEKYGL